MLTFFNPGVAPTIKSTVSVLGISGVIGFLAMIFKTDLPIGGAIAIHFIGTFILFWVMCGINQWQINVSSILLFLFIYIVIWIICLLEQKKTIDRINVRIKKRNINKN
ncbi:hypothetical protein FC29_GL001120 [Lactobacillus acidophilus DSM 20079 = JCM 1132 = NBRC 13951 = CIP 76.13]|nr:hypothetical protein FC29_GL001120 [Lactobacillus acidophilus DSM 20079 = JCM 1132 = NBRC 13951 = CIP 76.13]